MLAQNFMTADDLRIKAHELDALIATLGMLERGELQHVTSALDAADVVDPQNCEVGLFNMNWWSNKTECGTVCCIGGTAEAIMKEKFGFLPASLRELFYGHLGARDATTPAQAALALRNYLTRGTARWDEVLGAR